jgi:succinate dehydrogenase/fumarate reductase flavoprotein subunit
LIAEPGPDAAAVNPAALLARLQDTMSRHVGPFRTEAGLRQALAEFARLAAALGRRPAGAPRPFDTARLDWFDLRNMLLVASVVAEAALARGESRGAHQREDLPGMSDEWAVNQTVSLKDGTMALARVPVGAGMDAAAAQ